METLVERKGILYQIPSVGQAFTAGGSTLSSGPEFFTWIHQELADLTEYSGGKAQLEGDQNFPKVFFWSQKGNGLPELTQNSITNSRDCLLALDSSSVYMESIPGP